jgi:4-amino-4-deoxy-L-arabinose transferase-like glycosyltransferase
MLDHPGRTVTRADLLALILVTLLAAVLRFYRLDAIPPGFHYDEAYEALEAWRVVTQPGYHPIVFPGNFGVEPFFIYLTGVAFRLFGARPEVMRGVAALLGTLTVPLIYGLGRELVAWRVGAPAVTPIFAALALAIMRWHIHYSRVGIEPILLPLGLTVLLWTFWRGLRTGGLGAWLTLGIATGLGVYTYPAGRLFPPLVLALLALVWLLQRDLLRRNARNILLAGVVATLIIAPLVWNWVQHPDQLLLRSSQIAAGMGDTPDVRPLHNALTALAMFSFRGDSDPRNNIPGAAVLDVLMSIPFFLGLLMALRRWRQPVWSGLLCAGLVMLLPTILSEFAPHFRRALGASPVVAVLCGAGLGLILGRRADPAALGLPLPWRVQAAGGDATAAAATMARLRYLGREIVVAAILVGSAILSINGYFMRWGRDPALYYAYDQGLWEIGAAAREVPDGQPVLVTPRPATDMTLAFAWREGSPARHYDGRHALLVPASVLAGGPATYFVIEHEDFRGAGLLQELFPQARESRVFSDRSGKTYARALSVPPNAEMQRRPTMPSTVRWPDVTLTGYDLNLPSYKPGEIVYLQLWWQATGRPATDWTVFTHILGPPGPDGSTVWAGSDGRPGRGSVPTTAWEPGDLILDEYQIQLPPDIPPGKYEIEVGLYDPASGGARAQTSEPPGQDHAILGTIRVQ